METISDRVRAAREAIGDAHLWGFIDGRLITEGAGVIETLSAVAVTMRALFVEPRPTLSGPVMDTAYDTCAIVRGIAVGQECELRIMENGGGGRRLVFKGRCVRKSLVTSDGTLWVPGDRSYVEVKFRSVGEKPDWGPIPNAPAGRRRAK